MHVRACVLVCLCLCACVRACVSCLFPHCQLTSTSGPTTTAAAGTGTGNRTGNRTGSGSGSVSREDLARVAAMSAAAQGVEGQRVIEVWEVHQPQVSIALGESHCTVLQIAWTRSAQFVWKESAKARGTRYGVAGNRSRAVHASRTLWARMSTSICASSGRCISSAGV